MSDFFSDFSDPSVFLNYEYSFQVVHNNTYSIEAMTDHELRIAIIHDLLAVTMLEKQYEKSLHYGMSKFLQFIPRCMHKRVQKQMKHDEICELIDIRRIEQGSEIRIKDNHVILQAAMDYVGCWFTGYIMPPDAMVFNRDAFETMVKEAGGFDQFVESFMMDIICNVKVNSGENIH